MTPRLHPTTVCDSQSAEVVIEEVAHRGYALLPQAVGSTALQMLRVPNAFRPIDEILPSGVRQQYDLACLSVAEAGELGRFGGRLAATLGALSTDRFGLAGLSFNEIAVHRYRREHAGIGAHRDMRFYRYVIASLTLAGAGVVQIVRDDATPIEELAVEAGDLYLLRASGFGGGRGESAAASCRRRL
jgi:hypothetical protein